VEGGGVAIVLVCAMFSANAALEAVDPSPKVDVAWALPITSQ
jgi:hypothetical protein